MPNLTARLKQKLEGATRIAFLGVGSELRGDDAAGLLMAALLHEYFQIPKLGVLAPLRENTSEGFRAAAGDCVPFTATVLVGGTAPENVTGEIKRFKPSHLVILDAGDMGKKPGEMGVYSTEDIHGVSFSTHRLPLSILVKYLAQFDKFQTLLLAVQPSSLAFGAAVSAPVKAAVAKAFAAIKQALPRSA